MDGLATRCVECDGFHAYTEIGVYRMIHALETIRERAGRSDASRELADIARMALLTKDTEQHPNAARLYRCRNMACDGDLTNRWPDLECEDCGDVWVVHPDGVWELVKAEGSAMEYEGPP